MLAALREHLDGDVVGDEIVVYEPTKEGEFRFGRGGEAHLDLLETYLDEHVEKLEFFFQAHGRDERLIAVAQVYAAPYGRFVDAVFGTPVGATLGRHIITLFVLGDVFHVSSFGAKKKAP